MRLISFTFIAFLSYHFVHGQDSPSRKTCTITPNPSGSDDTPSILSAFSECGHGGRIVFLNETYHVNSVMNTTGLVDCEVDLHGTLLVNGTVVHSEVVS